MKTLTLAGTAVVFSFCAQAGVLPVEDGLVWHMDAADPDTVFVDDDGLVTNWVSRVGDGKCVNQNGGFAYPWLKADGIGGKPAVVFGWDPAMSQQRKTLLGAANVAEQKISLATVFFVVNMYSGSSYSQGYVLSSWGNNGYCHEYKPARASWQGSSNVGSSPMSQGWAFKDGKKCGDAQNGVFTSGDNIVGVPFKHDVAHEATFMPKATWTTFRPCLGCGASSQSAFLYGAIGEVIVFDRMLEPSGRALVEAYLFEKWGIKPVSVWQGGDGDWSTAANWSDNAVLAADSVALVTNGTVTVSAAAAVDGLTVAGDGEVKIDGATLSAVHVDIGGAATLTDGAAVRLTGDWLCDASSSLSYSGTVLLDSPYHAFVQIPAATTAQGTIRRAHGARTKFLGSGPAVGAHALKSGVGETDLCGTTQTFASLEGQTPLADSVGGGKVIVDAAGCAEFAASMMTAIPLEKKGDGTLSCAVANGGEVKVSAGTLKVSRTISPAVLPGLAMHLDASDADTLERLPDDRVAYWHSKTADGGYMSWYVPKNTNFNYTNGVYSATALNGKPGVLFGKATAAVLGSAVKSSYTYSKSVTARTVMMVMSVDDSQYAAETAVWGYWNNIKRITFSSSSRTFATGFVTLSGTDSGGGFASVNGQVCYDFDAGISNPIAYTPATPMLLVMTTSNAAAEGGAVTDTPWLGNATAGNSNASMFSGVISEVLVYDSVLTAEQIGSISQSLMEKWDVAPAATLKIVNALSAGTSVALAEGVTLDLNATVQSVDQVTVASGSGATVNDGMLAPAALSVNAGDDGKIPTVTGTANWLLAETAVDFICPVKVCAGDVVKTTGSVSGTVGPVTGSTKGVNVCPHALRLGMPGLMLLLR